MATKYEPLNPIALSDHNRVMQPHTLPEVVHIEDSAMDVLIDFKLSKPATIEAEKSVDAALHEMKLLGVHLLLVVDKEQTVLGLISSEDILGEKLIKWIQEKRVERSQIPVKALMTSQKDLPALPIEALEHATIGHIINTLKQLQQQYLLVIRWCEEEKKQLIRGLFSASQISKQLHMDISSLTAAKSLAELGREHS